MAIQPLPSSTTRILGSCQALTTPSSLVKELIDNAIDAKATSIDVIISANTVDKVEVHDNGHGIAQEDLDSLGRHGHTSKLRNFEELREVGSSCLGFRGEALASSVSLGSVTITTRAEGEPVAFVVKLKATGGVSSKSSISHPIGTTVCVSNFLSALPVRRQTSISDASKTISKIKNILQSYALARLQVRFTLKVANTGKGNWSYIPHPKGYIKEAAIQVAGKDVAKQCIEIASPCEDDASIFDTIDEIGTTTANSFIRIRAFLPSPDSDFSKLKGGHYASVDSRPVSCTRGTLKKVMSSYKQHIRAFASNAGKEVPKDPFIYLRITCPIGSYDPNIEPAKDDVLFEDEDAILSAAERLFKSLYSSNTLPTPVDDAFSGLPAPQSAASHDSIIQQRVEVSKSVGVTDFQTPGVNYGTRNNKIQGHITADAIVDKAWGRELEVLRDASCGPQSPPSTLEHSDHNTLNPWILAKHTSTPATERGPQGSRTLRPRSLRSYITPVDKTPPASSDDLFLTEDMSNRLTGSQICKQPRPGPTQSSVETWINKQQAYETDDLAELQHGPKPQQSHHITGGGLSRPHYEPPYSNGFVTARDLPVGVPWSPPPTQIRSKEKLRRKFKTPFIIPKSTEVVPGVRENAYESSHLTPLGDTSPSQGLPRTSISVFHDDVNAAMDFERRKATSTRRLREETAAVARLEAETGDVAMQGMSAQENIIKTVLQDGDPRAYLMRRQKSMAAHQGPELNRAKTMLLPLESIPDTLATQNLILRMTVETTSVSRAMHIFTTIDDYAKSGIRYEGLRMTDSGAREVEKSLNKLMTVSHGLSALT
ncbi:hypothetical protein VC83_05106 [Pseudogymnoascus destructans]|uniref:DNA mismatch repair protein S5 domain-containing protein n=2 Tax=Pseudogymnoascus destructans TaxID=655981 RepID=L8FVU0_PSED2|nr:uncharacterized protein VC83_05106 [Pseudogymnoascus destructans]ELR05007.1 hypothetical protein GMDG_01578 [Pseudogymnoascus destructans 20631-21]OAF58744.1 hypothetical protein VC83_05106 [Pseudogymnoascus destructans]